MELKRQSLRSFLFELFAFNRTRMELKPREPEKPSAGKEAF